MTVSEHVYTAIILGVGGAPNTTLHLDDDNPGSITLDAGSSPHVTATLNLAPVDAATRDLMDPRQSPPPRVRISVAAEFPSTSQTRDFNMSIRSMGLPEEDEPIVLQLASDEALLADFAPLVDDLTPYTYQSSLRDVIDYVLGEAIPGASLESSPSNDASVSAPSDALNMIPDPSNEGDGSTFIAANCSIDVADTSWSASGSTCINLYSPTTSDSFAYIVGDTGDFRLGLEAGKTYVLSATGRVKVAVGGTAHSRARRVVVMYRNGTGAYQTAASAALPTTVGAETRVSVTVTIPPTATEAFVRAYLGHTVGQVQWDTFRLSEKPIDPTDPATTYFSGGTTDTATYLYDWSGDPNESTSQRTSLVDRAPDCLVWKAGTTALEFLHPLYQAAGFRLVCDEDRQWTLRGETYRASGSISVRYAVNMIAGDALISRESGLWFDARVTRYKWTDRDGMRQERIDAYAMSTPYTRLTTMDVEAAYPGPGRSQYAVSRAQGRGREVSAERVANWTAEAEQPVTLVSSDGTIQTGLTQSVRFNLADDTMRVETRTIELPLGSIDLLTGSIDALTGTIDSL